MAVGSIIIAPKMLCSASMLCGVVACAWPLWESSAIGLKLEPIRVLVRWLDERRDVKRTLTSGVWDLLESILVLFLDRLRQLSHGCAGGFCFLCCRF